MSDRFAEVSFNQQANDNHSLQYDGTLGHLCGIWLINLFLKLVTLGIYSFLGNPPMRKYIVSSLRLFGERFEYTGTGGKLFSGFLKVVPIIIVISIPFFNL